MPSEHPPAERETIAIEEADIDEVLAMSGGDPRTAIKTLLIGQQFLEMQLEEARQEASWGYVRGRPSRSARNASEG